jgi:hypothetical protein
MNNLNVIVKIINYRTVIVKVVQSIKINFQTN